MSFRSPKVKADKLQVMNPSLLIKWWWCEDEGEALWRTTTVSVELGGGG